MTTTISEKTLTHPTDAICWDQLPEGKCELEYRPRSAFELTKSSAALALQLTKNCLVVNGAAWLIYWVILPHYGVDRNPLRLIAVVSGGLLGAFVLLLDPRRSFKRKWPTTRVALLMPAMLIIGSWVYQAVGYDVGVVGCLLYAFIATPLVLRLCAQLNTHTVFWLTTDLSEPQKHQWRTAFVPDSPSIERSDIRDCRTEQRWCRVLSATALLTTTVVILFFRFVGQTFWTWPALILPVLALRILYVINGDSTQQAGEAKAIGHWLRFGRGVELAPYVFQSPCGSSTTRLLRTWIAAGALSLTLAMSISNARATMELGPQLEETMQSLAIIAWFDHLAAALVAPWILTFALQLNVSRTLTDLGEE